MTTPSLTTSTNGQFFPLPTEEKKDSHASGGWRSEKLLDPRLKHPNVRLQFTPGGHAVLGALSSQFAVGYDPKFPLKPFPSISGLSPEIRQLVGRRLDIENPVPLLPLQENYWQKALSMNVKPIEAADFRRTRVTVPPEVKTALTAGTLVNNFVRSLMVPTNQFAPIAQFGSEALTRRAMVAHENPENDRIKAVRLAMQSGAGNCAEMAAWAAKIAYALPDFKGYTPKLVYSNKLDHTVAYLQHPDHLRHPDWGIVLDPWSYYSLAHLATKTSTGMDALQQSDSMELGSEIIGTKRGDIKKLQQELDELLADRKRFDRGSNELTGGKSHDERWAAYHKNNALRNVPFSSSPYYDYVTPDELKKPFSMAYRFESIKR